MTLRGQRGYLRRQGNFLTTYLYSGLAIAGLRLPISVSLPPFRLSIRPNTPDLRVARKLVDGAFHEAIRAAKPLQYGLIIDAGGYIGTAAIAFANAFPDALVISLEPSRHNFEMLRKNTKHLPNVIARNEALGSRVETATLSDRNTGEWGFTVVKNPLDCPAPQALHDTLTTTIPQLLRAVGKGGIDLLKLDIEGAERDLFINQPEWVSATSVIHAELHDRIQPGCQNAFTTATLGRKTVTIGKKIMISSRLVWGCFQSLCSTSDSIWVAQMVLLLQAWGVAWPLLSPSQALSTPFTVWDTH